MKLIIQPGDGVAPVVRAIQKAKKTIDIVIFRFDRSDIERALHAAVKRGVVVRALIAHTNRGGEKRLRKLENVVLTPHIAASSQDARKAQLRMLLGNLEAFFAGRTMPSSVPL